MDKDQWSMGIYACIMWYSGDMILVWVSKYTVIMEITMVHMGKGEIVWKCDLNMQFYVCCLGVKKKWFSVMENGWTTSDFP